MILADATPDAAVAIWIAVIGLLLGVAGQITNWIVLNKAQKRVVSFEGTPVDKEDFDAAVARLDREKKELAERIDCRLEKMTEEAQEGRRRLYEKMEPVARELAALTNECQNLNKSSIEMRASFERSRQYRNS